MTEPRAADDPRAGDQGSGPAQTGPEPEAVSTAEAATGAGGAEPATGADAGATEAVASDVVAEAAEPAKAPQDGPEPTTPIVIRDRRRVSATGPAPKTEPAGERGTPAAGAEPAAAVTEPGPAAEAPTARPEATEGAEVAEPAAAGGLGAELEALRTELEERTKDLQRLTAEYANYRKRVERDRALVAEQATGTVLNALLPVLDDLDRAREHGDLVGPFGAVAEHLLATVSKFGLTAFGEKGDPFDPTRHEAVAHQTSSEVTEPTCVEIMRRGYLLGDKLLRPALVAVADPE